MVFVECDVDPAQALAEAQWVSEQARRDKRIQAIIPHAPLEQGDSVLLHLEQLAEMKLVRGVRRLLQSEPDAEFCLRPRFVEAVRLLSRFGWSFDICITYRQMDSVIRLADLCPAVPMVLDHLGKPNIREGMLEPWRTQMAELARRENVVCKLSGVATEADHSRWDREELKPFMEAALSAFGPKRLMFGGDWPVSTQAISYRGWLDVVEWVLASLSVSELTSVFRDGARAFYRLP
jgi:L-fuconolactonase